MSNKLEYKNKNKRKKRRRKKKLILFVNTLIVIAISIIINNIFINNKELYKQKFKNNIDKYFIEQSGKSFNNSKSESNQYLILVNKKNELVSSYEPNDLVIPSIRFNAVNNMIQHVRTEVAKALQEMFTSAENDGINLIAISGYRSYEYQEVIYNESLMSVGKEETEKFVALPGTSEHQTGLAMDVLSSEYSYLDEGFENTEAYRWLSDNISKYGFIIRYPKGKKDITGYEYEPWHLRYVGEEAAIEINEEQLTLEEYLDKDSN